MSERLVISRFLSVVHNFSALPLALILHYRAQSNFISLYRLLKVFPSLSHLRLDGASFSNLLTSAERLLYAPDSVEFIVHHPSLSSLLIFLNSTTVLSFEWRRGAVTEEVYRWVRKSRTEDFVVERYQ